MIKAVLFDLDHTLYDRAATFMKLAPEFVRQFADCFADGQMNAEEAARMLYKADRDKYANWPMAFDELADLLHWTPPEYGRYKAFMQEYLGKYAVPWEDTYSALEACRGMGLALGMVTNGNAALQNAKIEALGIRHYFDFIVISGEFGADKPDPSIFLHAAALAGCPPEAVAFVGDNPVNDILASAAVGMTPIWMDHFVPWPEGAERPGYVAHGFGDVAGIIRTIYSPVPLSHTYTSRS